MPLKVGTSKKTFSENLMELLKSGRDKKQALAISYSKQREAEKKAGKPETPEN